MPRPTSDNGPRDLQKGFITIQTITGRLAKLRRDRGRLLRLLLMPLMLALSLLSGSFTAAQGQRVSQLGQYWGYSTGRYTEWVRTSHYVAVRDGTKLAVDIIRPAVNGKVVEDKLPVLFDLDRYHRARKLSSGVIMTQAELYTPAETWLRYGYVIVSADLRGSGVSFGTRAGEFLDTDVTDAYDLIDWISQQTWSNGKVGMYGISYTGMSQWMAAGGRPPALKAIAPAMTGFDVYGFAYPGGIYNSRFVGMWADMANEYADKEESLVPVDEDTDGSMAKAAQQQHQVNLNVDQVASKLSYRDSVVPNVPQMGYSNWSLHRLVPGVNRSGVSVYNIAGWYDGYPRDQAAWFNNLTVPERLIFTPFDHPVGSPGWREMSVGLLKEYIDADMVWKFMGAEYLRFFDYTLKGIDNGIMNEPPVWYYTIGAPAGQAWRSSKQWPLANQISTKYYFQAGPSGSIASANDGLLNTVVPIADTGQDSYQVDYSTTMGPQTRWSAMVDGYFSYADMTVQGMKSLTYTTVSLAEPVEITGHPIVHLWVSSSADDGDFFVYLEKVDTTGYAHYLTEGVLRASHRALAEPPYKYMGLPYHRSFQGDIKSLSRNATEELVFDLLPTSVLFQPGERIRIRIVGADKDNFQTPQLDPAPTVNIHRSTGHASYIDLPVIPAQ